MTVILKREEFFKKLPDLKSVRNSTSTDDVHVADINDANGITYDDVNVDKLSQPDVIEQMLKNYCDDEEKYSELYVDLTPFVNQSAVCLQGKFSLHRTYIIFRTLGLRHLTVVDEMNHVIGIITRKDLMGFHMEEMLANELYPNPSSHFMTQSTSEQAQTNYPT